MSLSSLWRGSGGQVPWPFVGALTGVEAAGLWVVWIVFGPRPGWLLQIAVTGVGLVGWLELQRIAAAKSPLVPTMAL